MDKKNRITVSPLDLWKELGKSSKCAICIILCVIVNLFIVYATRGITLYNVNGEVIQPAVQAVLRFCFTALIECVIALVIVIVFSFIADLRKSYANAMSRKARRIVTDAIIDMIAIESNCNHLNIPFKEYTVDYVGKTYTLLYDNDDVCYNIKFDDFKDLLDFDKIEEAWKILNQ